MKGIKITLIILAIIILTGCAAMKKEKTPEQIICENIKTSVEEYKADKMTFEEISILAENYYDQQCVGNKIENSKICIALNSIVRQQNTEYEIRDCSQFKEGVFKDACESSNTLVEEMLSKKEKMEKIYVENLETRCTNLEEE